MGYKGSPHGTQWKRQLGFGRVRAERESREEPGYTFSVSLGPLSTDCPHNGLALSRSVAALSRLSLHVGPARLLPSQPTFRPRALFPHLWGGGLDWHSLA